MRFQPAKPDRHAKCICCGNSECLTEYQFGDNIKTCIVLCCKCVANMYLESVSHKHECSPQMIAEADCKGDIAKCGNACGKKKKETWIEYEV